jgi:antitoxin VapB
MARARIFKSGNSQAVRLPREIAYPDPDIELEISRAGDVVTIYPARPSLKDAVAQLRRMPKPSGVERRHPIDVPIRKRD